MVHYGVGFSDPVPKASCGVEALRQALGVTCPAATSVAVLMGMYRACSRLFFSIMHSYSLGSNV